MLLRGLIAVLGSGEFEGLSTPETVSWLADLINMTLVVVIVVRPEKRTQGKVFLLLPCKSISVALSHPQIFSALHLMLFKPAVILTQVFCLTEFRATSCLIVSGGQEKIYPVQKPGIIFLCWEFMQIVSCFSHLEPIF